MTNKRIGRLILYLFYVLILYLMNISFCRFEVLDEEPGDEEESGGQRLAISSPLILHHFIYLFSILEFPSIYCDKSSLGLIITVYIFVGSALVSALLSSLLKFFVLIFSLSFQFSRCTEV